MKLCNHRDPRNGPGSCCLRACDVSGAKWNYQSSQVFVKEGLLPDPRRWFTQAFQCTERMSAVCPYRIHTVIVKPLPKPKPEKCKRCGARHYDDRGVAQLFCDAKDEFEKLMQPWNPEGSRQSIYSEESFNNQYRPMLWPWIAGMISKRDKHRCQDCGMKMLDGLSHGQQIGINEWDRPIYLEFEVHHIIPKALGGSDHPANLKLVCKNCHSKYNERFNGEIISKKAKERRVQKIQKVALKVIEEFT